MFVPYLTGDSQAARLNVQYDGGTRVLSWTLTAEPSGNFASSQGNLLLLPTTAMILAHVPVLPASTPFILRINTVAPGGSFGTGLSNNLSFQLPIAVVGSMTDQTFFVDWGAGGGFEEHTPASVVAAHVYSSSGIYDISIRGNAGHLQFQMMADIVGNPTPLGDSEKVVTVRQFGTSVVWRSARRNARWLPFHDGPRRHGLPGLHARHGLQRSVRVH